MHWPLLVLALLLALAPAPPARADEPAEPDRVTRMAERVDLRADGVAEVTWAVEFGALNGSTVDLPLNYPWIERAAARYAGGETLPVETVTVAGVDYLRLGGAGIALADRSVEVTFRDPAHLVWKNAGPGAFGIYRFANAFVETARVAIDAYELEVVLPAGFLVNAIEKSVPTYTEKDPVPPYQVRYVGDRSAIVIAARDLTLGKQCRIEYSFVARKNPVLLTALLLLLAIGFLVGFRDVLKPPAERAG